MTATTATTAELADQAAPLDALLIDAALGPVRRFCPTCLPLGWATSLARQPLTCARRVRDLASETLGSVVGTSTLAPEHRDRRFTDVAWTENPLLRRIVQLYLAGGRTVEQLVADADLELRDQQRVRFLVENLIAGDLAQQRPAGQPGVRQGGDRHGGAEPGPRRHAAGQGPGLGPAHSRRWSTQSGYRGRATTSPRTPGAVVLRTEVLELIQYAPQTDEVYEVPALVVPPTINKFYATRPRPGTQPGRVRRPAGPADVRHLLAQPGRAARLLEPRHLRAAPSWTPSTPSRRSPAASRPSSAASAPAASWPASRRVPRRRSAGRTGWPRSCLAVTVIDNDEPGRRRALVDRRLAATAKAKSARKGYLDGRALAEVFAWLRPGDLVWNYWVNNYLLGKTPPAFDILFWNSDTTRMTAGLHADFVDLAMDNKLADPGALYGARGADRPVPDHRGLLRRRPGSADHITPWQSCYRTTQLLGGHSPLRAVHQWPHRRPGQPARKPEGVVPHQRWTTWPTPTSLAASGAETNHGSWWTDVGGLARPALRRPSNRARQSSACAGLPVAGRCARHLRLRHLKGRHMFETIGRSRGTDFFRIADQLTPEERDYWNRTRALRRRRGAAGHQRLLGARRVPS